MIGASPIQPADPRSHQKPARRLLSTIQQAIRVPFYPLLLTAYPVLLLYSDNLSEGIGLQEVIPPLVLALAVTGIGYLLLGVAWRSAGRAAIVVTAAVVPCLLFGPLVNMIEQRIGIGLLHEPQLWPDPSIIRSQLVALLAWLVIVLSAIALAARAGGKTTRYSETLNVVALVLVVLAATPIAGFWLWPAGTLAVEQTVPSAVQASRQQPPGRDIYHLVFDRYGSQSSLRAGYGIDNSEFVGWLEERGFQVADNAHANYWRTLPSLSSMFRMSLLDDLAVEMGPNNPNPRPLHELLWSNPAAATLQELGYSYVHLGSWFQVFVRSNIADYVGTTDHQVDFGSVVLGNSPIPFVRGLLEFATGTQPNGVLNPWAQAALGQFERVESTVSIDGPKLVYAHFLVPHPPYVFLEDGTVDPQRASFESQLRFTNTRIRRLLEQLLDQPEAEQPIIILQADEGPYPERYADDGDGFDWTTATGDELLMKFGILSAWYLPGPQGEAPVPAGISLVNTYPEILHRYLGIEVVRSPDRSFASRGGRIYDHVDVTDRLMEAERSS